MSKIKDLPKVEQPREKLEKYGPEKLANSELLAILLRTGAKGVNAVQLSRKILKKFSHNKLASTSYHELENTFGLGKAKACEIIACFELSRRLLKGKKANLILSPENVWKSLRGIRDNKKEHFVIFYLDARNQEIEREIISVGTLESSLIHPREVFEPAVKNPAAHILLAHNHPSGNPEPSPDDIAITKRLVQAGEILGIGIVDHVIVTKDKFLSFKDKKLL